VTTAGLQESKNLEEQNRLRSWVMALMIVWRNPLPVIRTERALQRIRSDQFGAVYAVTGPDLTQEFEVILGEVA
jgi:hypothetical protein